ncbi:MAG TPA: universal stress protein [Solirubrobacterales bacterium]|jgi:nucleotide-binding universal stress UspA family protein
MSPLRRKPESAGDRRILFPFLGSVLSERSLDATIRLARAQEAMLIPAYLAVIPKELSIEAPLGVECEGALALLELIEQRATKAGVEVDSRIERGRTARHALADVIENERFDSIVLPARTSSSDGFTPADVAWALETAPGEVLVLRPGREPAR